ncbi:hypothetical protein [Bacteroides sedimenti]
MIINKMKLVYFIFLLCFFIMNSSAQTYNAGVVEESAVKYFCDNVLKKEARINQLKIQFNGATNGKPSNVYDVANCLEDINLLKDSIPNKEYLDSLERKYFQIKSNVIKISSKCERFSKRSLFKRNYYRLYLYNAIEYNEIYCVEFFLANKNYNTFTIIVFLDKKFVPMSYCIKAITY